MNHLNIAAQLLMHSQVLGGQKSAQREAAEFSYWIGYLEASLWLYLECREGSKVTQSRNII